MFRPSLMKRTLLIFSVAALLGTARAQPVTHSPIDLSKVLNADGSKGLFTDRAATNETIRFKSTGRVMAERIPFQIPGPGENGGTNLLALKGGQGLSLGYAQRVEIPVGVAASHLHFLGGVAAHAWPCCGVEQNANLGVAKITVYYEGGASQQFIFRNGREFADYSQRAQVPDSTDVSELLERGHLRYFSKKLGRQTKLERLVLESYNNSIVPVFAGITAQLAAPAGPTRAPAPVAAPINTLIFGGGEGIDFKRVFGGVLLTNLEERSFAKVTYTESEEALMAGLGSARVLILAQGRPVKDPKAREAILRHLEQGHGLVVLNQATGKGLEGWEELRKEVVGGRSGETAPAAWVDVNLADFTHPLTKGMARMFRIKDQLLQFEQEAGSTNHVIAKAKVPGSGVEAPVVWINTSKPGRVVGISLGTDLDAHFQPSFRALLKNAVKWSSERPAPGGAP